MKGAVGGGDDGEEGAYSSGFLIICVCGDVTVFCLLDVSLGVGKAMNGVGERIEGGGCTCSAGFGVGEVVFVGLVLGIGELSWPGACAWYRITSAWMMWLKTL